MSEVRILDEAKGRQLLEQAHYDVRETGGFLAMLRIEDADAFLPQQAKLVAEVDEDAIAFALLIGNQCWIVRGEDLLVCLADALKSALEVR